MTPPPDLLAGLPGETLVREGLADARAGRATIPAYLVAIASPRILRYGLLPSIAPELVSDAELKLYELIGLAGGDAYSRYNSLLRELVSFENALDHRMSRSN